jgi:Protein of unknown function (DUF4058)
MPSPFPGMDPYLEAPRRWVEFHNHLAAELCAALNRTLDPRYVASLTSTIAYQAIEITPPRAIQPDMAVVRSTMPPDEAPVGVATLMSAPVESAIPWEVPLMLYRVEILTVEEERLVTVIEILSPSNKRRGHEDAQEYRRKRRDLCRSSAHLIEIDLLRGGERPPLEEPVPAASYYVLVSRAEQRPRVQVWPIQLRDPLPTVPVPVLEPDPDALLDLGAAMTSAYERGAFSRKINYQRPPPPPPLSVEEAAWVEEVLRSRRSRPGEP